MAMFDVSDRMDHTLPVTERLDLGKIMKLKVAHRLKPSFSTFNIQRSYQLRVKPTFERSQVSFKAEFPPNLLLLPAHNNPAPRERIQGAPMACRSRDSVEDNLAPSYFRDGQVPPPAYEH